MTEKTEIKKGMCVWCKGECGVLVHVKDGRLIKAVEDPDWPRKVHPPTRGCPRLRAAAEWFYHPNRVNFPLKRAGERGEGKWQRIPWEQALDEIAQKLKETREKYGGESIAYTGGTGYRTDFPPRTRFFLLLTGGAINSATTGNVCYVPRSTVADAIAGMFPHFSVRPSSKCIVLLGVEPLNSRPITYKSMLEALDNGAKLIVIDPRRTVSAQRADIWLQLRPGTDCALLLGMTNVIINENLYDKEFISKWCYGFDKLKERARQYPPEKVAEITGVPSDKIREAARLYATTRPGVMVEGMGIEHLENLNDILRTRWVLAALAGNIDVEGGEELIGPHPTMLCSREIVPPVPVSKAQVQKQIASDRFKFLTWPGRELLLQNLQRVWGKTPDVGTITNPGAVFRAMFTGQPYPVRAAITVASNPLVTQPNTKLVYKALKSLDFYMVMDFWMTPSAEIADYVLPIASWLERPIMWDFNGYAPQMATGEAAVPASMPGEYDHKTDYDIWRELSIRLGWGEYWPWKSTEEWYDMLLKPLGMTHNEYVHKMRCEKKPAKFRKYEQVGFATPTGKVELYSTIYEKLGYDPLPAYREPSETPISQPELAKEYPLTLLTGGRVRPLYHSEWRQIESVRKLHPYPLLDIHPETAAKLDIKDGDWVWIETLRGRVKHKAKLTDRVAPHIVHGEHGWWLPELPGEEPWLHGVWEMNINVVTNDDPDVCDPAIGTTPLRTALCKVYKVKTY